MYNLPNVSSARTAASVYPGQNLHDVLGSGSSWHGVHRMTIDAPKIFLSPKDAGGRALLDVFRSSLNILLTVTLRFLVVEDFRPRLISHF